MPKFTVEKSIQINAPIDQVYPAVRDFRQWTTWSPWLLSEPECEPKYADDGNSYSWDGKIIGAGEMEISSEDKPNRIDYKLTFLKPWKSTNETAFTFTEKDGATEATWTMIGSLPWFMFWMKGMMTVWVGMDYERGLKMLKDYLEMGKIPSTMNFAGSLPFKGFAYVGKQSDCKITEIGEAMSADFERLRNFLEENHLEGSAVPFAQYLKWEMTKGNCRYLAGIPLANIPESLPPDLISGVLPDCQTYRIEHKGNYRHLGNAWSAGMMHSQAKVFAQNKKIMPFETYETMPTEPGGGDEEVTHVHFPVK